MAYIQRDTAGKITAIFDAQQTDEQEYIATNDPELRDFIAQINDSAEAKNVLAASDSDLIRVLEDLIDTLIDKKAILFTDLPLAAREKLANRGKVREHLTSLDNLVDDNEGLL